MSEEKGDHGNLSMWVMKHVISNIISKGLL